jgi:hypothetical protein
MKIKVITKQLASELFAWTGFRGFVRGDEAGQD